MVQTLSSANNIFDIQCSQEREKAINWQSEVYEGLVCKPKEKIKLQDAQYA